MRHSLLALTLLFANGIASADPISHEPSRSIYQIYVRAFYDGSLAPDGEGDFAGLTAKADYFNELGIDTSSLQDKINKAELELEQFKAPIKKELQSEITQQVINYSPNKLPKKKDVFEKIGDNLVDNLIKYDDLDPKEQIVKYDSATGLFSNNKKDIGFKDVVSARKHNEAYEKYVPEIQKLKKAVTVTPSVKPSVKPFVKPLVKPTVLSPIPEFDMSYRPYI